MNYSMSDGDIILDLKSIMESDGFPVGIQIGDNYQDMKDLVI